MTSIDPNKYKLSDKTKNLIAQGEFVIIELFHFFT